MQEIELSNDLNQIEFEIKQYENAAGRNFYEIGRRINWVKQNDLSHGEFLKFLKKIKMNSRSAEMFMKIAKDREIGNSQPDSNLGISVLYELTRIPNEMRNEPQQLDSGETKKPVDMTRREIQELNRKLKQSEEANKTLDGLLSEKADTISALEQQVKNKPKPEVVEKTVTKEVTPSDYEELKREASITSDLRQRNSQTQQEMDDIKSQLEKAKADAEFYQKELSAAERIKKNNQKLDDWERDKQRELSVLKVQTAISIYSLIHDIQDFLKKENIVRDVSQAKDLDDESKRDLQEANEGLQRFVDKVNQILDGRKIIEGEFSE